MIEFKQIHADINEGNKILEKSLSSLDSVKQVVFIVDNCNERLERFMQSVGKINGLLLTFECSKQKRIKELEKWISGKKTYLFVKNLYHRCNIVHSAIIEHANAIIQTRNIFNPNNIIQLLNDWNAKKKEAVLECIYLLTDFEFSYDKIASISYVTKVVNANPFPSRLQVCRNCNELHEFLTKTCPNCGYESTHESYLDTTRLRIGIVGEDFNPLYNNKLRVKPLRGIDYLLGQVNNIKSNEEHKRKKLDSSLHLSSKDKILCSNILNETLSSYQSGTLVCYIYDSNSTLTFLSRVPPSVCKELIDATTKNHILNTLNIPDVPELLVNLCRNELSTTISTYGHFYDFGDTERMCIKKKFLESELVALTMANAGDNKKRLEETICSDVNLYAKRLLSLLVTLDCEKLRRTIVTNKANYYKDSLGIDLGFA